MSFFRVIKIIIGIYCYRLPFGVFVRSPNRFMFTLISNALGVFPGLLPIINFKVSTLLFDIFLCALLENTRSMSYENMLKEVVGL